ncbi:Auxilin-like protein 1 [Cardamine amara subsp. amara]|uniref:Auxilin-like protein 1 n=1 Tax=Cardamine amara subsp. amara TaxID=228776 RepID=A0ABD1B9C8_CARAN
MENISHSGNPNRSASSLTKKPYNGSNNGTGGFSYNSGKTINTTTTYDDVFGGPPRFGAPTLSPRLEDYCEIFSGFNGSSRAAVSSIPVLDLPLVDDRDVYFDVRSHGFDYREVFGGFNDLDLAPSYEELFLQQRSTVADNDSSDDAWTPEEVESCSGGTKSPCFSNGRDSYDSIEGSTEFNISYNKATQISGDSNMSSSGVIRVADLGAIPGYTVAVDGMISGSGTKKLKEEIGPSSIGKYAFEDKEDRGQKYYSGAKSFISEPFVTVSEIGLKTHPTGIPPPTRPPPILKSGFRSSASDSRTTGSERSTDSSSPPFFDVEVDASSAAVREAMVNAEAKLKSAKELFERKRDGTRIPKNNRMREEGKSSNTARKSLKDKHGSKSLSSQGSLNSDGNDEWKEATEFVELVRTELPRNADENSGGKGVSIPLNAEFMDQELTWAANVDWDKQRRRAKGVRDDHEAKKLPKHPPTRKVESRHKRHEDRLAENAPEERKNEKSRHVELQSDRIPHRQTAEKNQECVFEWEQNARKLREALGLADNESTLEVSLELNGNGKKLRMPGETGQNETKMNEALQRIEEETRIKEARRVKEENDRRKREAFEKAENEKRLKVAFEQEEKERKIKEAREREENKRRVIEAREKAEQERKMKEQQELELQLKEAFEKEEKNRRMREAREKAEHERKIKAALEEENERKIKEAFEKEEKNRRMREALEKAEHERKIKAALEEEKERKIKEDFEKEENERRLKEAREKAENERKMKAALEEEKERKIREAHEKEENERRINEAREKAELEQRLKEALEQEEKERRIKEFQEREEKERKAKEVLEQAENERKLKEALEKKEKERRLKEAREKEENEKKLKEAIELEEKEKRLIEAFERAEIVRRLKEDLEQEEMKMRLQEAKEREERERTHRENQKHQENRTKQQEYTGEESDQKQRDACEMEKTFETTKEAHGEQWSNDSLSDTLEEDERVDNHESVNKQKEEEGPSQRQSMSEEACPWKVFEKNLKDASQKEETNELDTESSLFERNEEAPQLGENGRYNQQNGDSGEKSASFTESIQGEKLEQKSKIFESSKDANASVLKRDIGMKTDVKERSEGVVVEDENVRKAGVGRDRRNPEESKSSAPKTSSGFTQAGLNQDAKVERPLPSRVSALREKEAERLKRERDSELERLRKIEEEREREREREKDRMAFDQRALADARERLERACAEAREKSLPDKLTIEARLRAERAAVERATTEARERAAEKAAFEARERMERSVSDKQFQSSASFGAPRYQNSPGADGESPQRYTSRLERHRRTADRVAKALAEKNMRDLVAQREQAERIRIAETLDAEVKRWSNGKEGNIRALLSTLQYILGPESGWQPLPLTEVITSAAVKRAYRKATLCVHPDKLQQRGANIHQKYICEKVFDLLKEAWNRFNSEESKKI